MKVTALFLAMIFTGISAYFVYFGCTLDTSVASNDSAGVFGVARIANLQLMQAQMANLQIGLAAAVVAAIFWATTFIVMAMEVDFSSPPPDGSAQS